MIDKEFKLLSSYVVNNGVPYDNKELIAIQDDSANFKSDKRRYDDGWMIADANSFKHRPYHIHL